MSLNNLFRIALCEWNMLQINASVNQAAPDFGLPKPLNEAEGKT
jgi:hypothetical protein